MHVAETLDSAGKPGKPSRHSPSSSRTGAALSASAAILTGLATVVATGPSGLGCSTSNRSETMSDSVRSPLEC